MTFHTVLAIAGACAALLMSAACTTDKERIADQNEAAKTALPVTRTSFGKVSVFDLRAGDCLPESVIFADEDQEEEFGEETSVEVVDCGGTEAFGRVSLLHLIDEGDGATYPGDESMIALAEDLCKTPGQPFTYFVPVRESWVQGDRTVTCIESVGFDYAAGGCISDADDGHRMIPCESAGVFGEVLAVIDVTPQYGVDSVFPGNTALDAVVEAECPPEYDYVLYPTDFTWDEGDRLVICVLTV